MKDLIYDQKFYINDIQVPEKDFWQSFNTKYREMLEKQGVLGESWTHKVLRAADAFSPDNPSQKIFDDIYRVRY